mgnify:CR=1 FL=1
MQYKLLLVIILAGVYATEVRFTYSGRAYDSIHQVLGSSGYEVPDCGHHVEHITTVHDSDLNRNVFAFDLHVNPDDDRCINQDRQRTEMAVDAGSPSWMHGSDGKSFTYDWKFKLDAGFKESGLFCHLHQIKLDGGNVGDPNMTITARSTVDIEVMNMGTIASAPIAQFKGFWVHVREIITYGPTGCLDLTITRIKDGTQLIRVNKCGIPLGAKGGMIRPKWGFYRSLGDKAALRDERVLFADHCIGEGKTACAGL